LDVNGKMILLCDSKRTIALDGPLLARPSLCFVLARFFGHRTRPSIVTASLPAGH